MINFKETNIPWLGKIPADWEKVRFKDKYFYKKEIVGEIVDEYDRLALTLNGVMRRDKDASDGLQPAEFFTYQIVRKNDFIFKMIDLQNISTSRVGLSPFTGIVSPAYIRFVPKTETSQFIYFYFMTLYYTNVFNKLGGDGVRSALNATDLGTLILPFPNEKVQSIISSFLDRKTKQINELISIEEKQIEKLNEYKQSLISEVVTKGLDPNVPMKDSGIEWIGKIPSNWKLNKVKRLFYISKDLSIEDEPERVLKLARAGIVEKDVTKNEGQMAESYSNYNKVKKYDLLLNPMDLVSGANCNMSELDGVISPAYINLRSNYLNNKVNPKFYDYYFKFQYWVKALFAHGKGISFENRWTLSSQEILNYYVPQPSFEEQILILKKLNKKLDLIGLLIRIKEQKINRLNEYKKSLIYEYVTGKRTLEP